MLANCAVVRSILEADNVAEAEAKIFTYGEYREESGSPLIAYPMIMIRDPEVHCETDAQGALIDISQRVIEIWAAFYVPEREDIQNINDEHAWVLDQFSDMTKQCLALSGEGECVPGETFPGVTNPVFEGAEREPDDMRGDERLDPRPDRPRWFGLLMFEVK